MDEDTRTIWCGNLHENVTEEILYELFMQGGPVQKVSIPKDRDGKQKNFGFVTYKHECSVPYALDLFEGTILFNRNVNMKSRNNTVPNSESVYQFQHQLQTSVQDNRHQRNVQDELQLGQQILLGAIAPMAFASNNMFMMPESHASQMSHSSYSGSDYSRNSRHNRSHPYHNRDHFDRHNNRHDLLNRDHKPYKYSSHKSNRHDNRRKYR